MSAVDDWVSDVEQDVLKCLEGRGATPVAEVARQLELSESATASLLALLAGEGKVRILLVESPRPAADD